MKNYYSLLESVSCNFIGSFGTSFRFNVYVSYIFLSVDQKKLSTPLDWNKINVQSKIGFGIWFKIFWQGLILLIRK